MKKVVLIISHEGSSSKALCQILDNNPRVQCTHSNLVYNHPEVIESLVRVPHKLNNASAIWADELLYNIYFTNKGIYKFCRFIYVIREPKPTLSMIINESNAESMVRYYCYRLLRICEMAKETPGAVFLTDDDIVTGRCFPLLEKFLGLKEKLVLEQSLFTMPKSNPFVTTKMMGTCQRAYEYYFRYLKSLSFEFV